MTCRAKSAARPEPSTRDAPWQRNTSTTPRHTACSATRLPPHIHLITAHDDGEELTVVAHTRDDAEALHARAGLSSSRAARV